MSDVELRNITKHFPGVTALKNISFSIRDGEFFVLLGPTGAGKTTTLRTIAGLEGQDEGSVLFDGEVADELAPANRDVAFVFQQYSLYPTMTVYDNLAFPLRSPLRYLPEDVIKERVIDATRKLHIDHLIERKTAHLSGGEMQRVAIGRAIVREPRIFLMDEPLSNLDAKLREELRVELQHIQKTQRSTTLFVTHDQIEALTMADRIAVLNAGEIMQVGTPDDIYDRPATTFVAQLVGTPRINLFDANRADSQVHIKDSKLRLPAPEDCRLPADFLLGIRPEDVRPDPAGEFKGQVALTEPLGVETILHIQSGEQRLLSLVSGMTNLGIGDEVKFDVVDERIHCFDLDGNRVQS
ncbi:MAG: sn-glycerol-3-phosphate import ATP-binding protein UgpC [Anaerolineales bacterium]|nr:sn-glycerol-3-phosphate import ATP-binding protein UgpC [Anaerolineales bacterium]